MTHLSHVRKNPKTLRQQATPKGMSASGMWPNGSLQLARSDKCCRTKQGCARDKDGGTEDGVVCLVLGLPAYRPSPTPDRPHPAVASSPARACRMDRSWPLGMTKAWSRLGALPSDSYHRVSCRARCCDFHLSSLLSGRGSGTWRVWPLGVPRIWLRGYQNQVSRCLSTGHPASHHSVGPRTCKADQCPALQRLRDLARRRML